jgi:Fur family ferric uptake transcriptional regulator
VSSVSQAAADDVQVEVVRLLQQRSLRVTLARRAVMSVLVAADRADEHVSVETIGCRVGDVGPDLSTIYRTVASLAETGLVHQTPVDGGASLYRLVGGHAESDHHHAHLRCLSCGSVSDAPAALADPLRASLADQGFDLDIARTVLVGTCATCRAHQLG